MGTAKRRLEVALGDGPVPLDPDTVEGRLETAERRIRALELAVEALDRRTPREPKGPTKTLFGVAVRLAPNVDDDAVRSEVDQMPAGLDSDQVVDLLEERGMLARVKAAGR